MVLPSLSDTAYECENLVRNLQVQRVCTSFGHGRHRNRRPTQEWDDSKGSSSSVSPFVGPPGLTRPDSALRRSYTSLVACLGSTGTGPSGWSGKWTERDESRKDCRPHETTLSVFKSRLSPRPNDSVRRTPCKVRDTFSVSRGTKEVATSRVGSVGLTTKEVSEHKTLVLTTLPCHRPLLGR